MTINEFLHTPNQLKFHQLSPQLNLPSCTHLLLGLGSKFCIEKTTPQHDLKKTFGRLSRDIRLKAYVKQMGWENTSNDSYNPKIYIKSKMMPPFAQFHVEEKLEDFKIHIERLNNLVPCTPKYNLTPIQRRVLTQLRRRDDIIILNTDKNLGIAVIDRTEYVTSIYMEHFSHTNLYAHLTPNEAQQVIEASTKAIKNILIREKETLTKAEQTYFDRSYHQKYRIAVFYGAPKIHKEKLNGYYRTRPVVAKCGTFVEIASRFVDYHLQKIIPLFRSYLKDSFTLLHDLQQLRLDPHKSYTLLTADAVSMYTFINTEHATTVLTTWLNENTDRLPHQYPISLLIDLLEVIMSNNVFVFGDLFYRQMSGTAMGTSVAPAYATIYYGIHEERTLLDTFGQNLLYYRRYIDDIFVLWENHPDSQHTPEQFHAALPFGDLTWTMSPPARRKVFLDLNIWINDNNTIQTSTYHKPLNLHLFIPPASAHPPGVLFGLIAGSVRRFWLQNTTNADFQHNIKFLFEKLKARGHNEATLRSLFQRACETYIERNGNVKRYIREKTTKSQTRTMFFHQEYHPCGIPRRRIQEMWRKSIGELSFYDRQVVCYSRPKNLRDLLIPSTLSRIPGMNSSDIIGRHTNPE